MKKTIDTNEITDEMIAAALAADSKCIGLGVTDAHAVMHDSILAALKAAPAVEPAQSAAGPVASSFAPHMRFITNDELTEFQERNRARLEKSRLIDSPPTVPPAIVERVKALPSYEVFNGQVKVLSRAAVMQILEASND